MSRRLEFGRLRVLKEGDDAHAAQRAIARRLRGNSRRVAPSMLLLSLIGAAGIWLSLSELPHVRRIFIGELQSTLHPSLAPPVEPAVGARPWFPQTPVPVPEPKRRRLRKGLPRAPPVAPQVVR